MSVDNSNFTSVFFKTACQANLGTEGNLAGSDRYSSKQVFLKFSKTSASSNVSLLRYESWCSLKFSMSKSLQILLCVYNLHQ